MLQVLGVLAKFVFRFVLVHPMHYFRTFSFFFALPKRNPDPGSLGRLFPPRSTTVRAFIFMARRHRPFLPVPGYVLPILRVLPVFGVLYCRYSRYLRYFEV